MPSIPTGLTREHILRAISQLDAGVEHPFGDPTGYELQNEGKFYAPKAVIGIAAQFLIGRMLLPEEFSGGNAAGQANYVLDKLGFKVVRIREDWTPAEVNLCVSDYFEMLREELLGVPLNKAVHRRALLPRLNGRSDGSVEFKHSNISAVLVELGLPYVDGYKPRGNYQGILKESIEAYLDAHPDYFESLVGAGRLNPQEPVAPAADLNQIFVPPPEIIIPPTPAFEPWNNRRKRPQIDFVKRDANNKRLGDLGEEFVLNTERRRLDRAGRQDLSRKVEWVAKTCGDGVGFDILSFNELDASERFVEVKTTGLGKFFPFYVSANEVRCSEAVPEKFQLYRVFDYAVQPRVYVLPGALSRVCQLRAMIYRATLTISAH